LIGNKLFGSSCPAQFIFGDIFSPSFLSLSPNDVNDTGSSLNHLKGRLTSIYCGALFHLFNEEAQEVLARKLATLWKRDVRGKGIIFGKHVIRVDLTANRMDDYLGR
jgi:hypothetical protein